MRPPPALLLATALILCGCERAAPEQDLKRRGMSDASDPNVWTLKGDPAEDAKQKLKAGTEKAVLDAKLAIEEMGAGLRMVRQSPEEQEAEVKRTVHRMTEDRASSASNN